MLALAIILVGAGAFQTGLSESAVFLRNEFNHLADKAENSFGVLSVEGVALSERLAEQINRELGQTGLKSLQA
ncbi:MAG: hypothetical protein LBS19_04970 [Clostridiales bacterium]|nr:hypothetical protein [Clostridiales bacterium]